MKPLCVAHFHILGGKVESIKVKDHDTLAMDAALAIAALANGCKDVPLEPKCQHTKSLREAGWILELMLDNEGFFLRGRPPNGRGTE